MLLLYLSGTWLTFTQHDWNTWGFARNLSFNFFGFSMLIYAWRAIELFRDPGVVRQRAADRLFALLLTVSVAAMAAVAWFNSTPMKVFTVVGAAMCVVEWKELRSGVWDKALLYRRHQRYVLASYFYVLTVVSVVHLKDELPTAVRWLWPTVIGGAALGLLLARSGSGSFLGLSRSVLTRRVVLGILTVAVAFGGYVMFDLVWGPPVQGQG